MLKRRWLSVTFFISLLLCVALGQISLLFAPVALSQTVTTQAINLSIQQGLRRYQTGDFKGAIALTA